GLLTQATSIANMFIEPSKALVIIRSRDRGEETLRSRHEPPFHQIPVAVLIDESSASASEILAGALRDHEKAVLIGKRSYGKGSVQSVIDLRDGQSLLKLTTAYYFTPSGRRIDRGKV